VPAKKATPLVLLTWSDVLNASDKLPPDQKDLLLTLVAQERLDDQQSNLASDGRWFISRVEIRGHVGIGETPLILKPKPATGIVFVAARNGVGKTSAADAVRHVLSGGSGRRYDLTAENVHYGRREIRVTVTDGQREAVIGCSDDSKVTWEGSDIPPEWASAYQRFRPVLLYPEISPMIENPAQMHEFLQGGLETEVLAELLSRVDEVRNQGRDAKRRVDEALAQVRSLPDGGLSASANIEIARSDELPSFESSAAIRVAINDEPIREDDALIPTWSIDLDAVSAIIEEIEHLRQAKAMVLPGAMAVRQALEALLGEHSSGHSALEATVCPVCGMESKEWQAHARASLGELNQELSRVGAAQRRLQDCLENLEPSVPPPLSNRLRASLRLHGLEQLAESWDRLTAAKKALSEATATEATIKELMSLSASVASSYAVFRASRSTEDGVELVGRDRAKKVVESWLNAVEENRLIIEAGTYAVPLARWVEKAIKDTRSALFEPIADEVKEIWRQLNPDSGLLVTDVKLAGGTRAAKKVEFGLDVEGVQVPPGARTPSIMSTGQRNALSLATYFPRAAQPQSPFGFLVLDDPVQSFDSWRVRYLADHLRKVAERYQVIVMSHDERLWSELHRYGSIRQSIRLDRPQGDQSKVRVSEKSSGMLLLEDLMGTLNAEDQSPVGTPQAVTAMTLAMCRLALDAEVGLQIEIVGRRAGLSYSDIEVARGRAQDTRKKIVLLNKYAVLVGYPTIETDTFEKTISALNAAAHGRAPSASSNKRKQWVADVRSLIAATLKVSA
jgi:hypothetical protein